MAERLTIAQLTTELDRAGLSLDSDTAAITEWLEASP